MKLGAAVAALAAGCGLVAGCGTGDQAMLSPTELGLAGGFPPATPASTVLHTSPDGGIYRNPDDLRVVLAAQGSAAPLDDRLHTTQDWRPLQPLGRLTYVGIRLRNDGKAGSDPRFNDLQIASDLAPDRTSAGPLRHFYHPTYPLAALSDIPISGDCSVHLDPSQSTLVLLVYPPLRPTDRLTWGRFADFSLDFGWAGGVPPHTGRLRAGVCAPPPAGP